MRRGAGFTLLEVLTALALATLVYAMVAFTTLQLSRTTREASRGAEARARLIRSVEQVRWQLRCLFVRDVRGASGDGAATPATPPVSTSARPGVLGNLAVYGKRTDEADREILLFRTSRLERGVGATEVGYRILEDQETGQPYLAYRQYPWADVVGLHPPEEDPETPWRVLSREIRGLKLEFSADGETWQREWDRPEVPKRIRVQLLPATGGPLVVEVVPGIEATRW